MNDMENKDLNPQQPEAPAEPAATVPQADQPSGPAPQAPAPDPAPAWEKPTPQLTLDPQPEPPAIEFTTEPPHAPEPPVEPQPTVQNQYVYNFNTQPSGDPGQPQSPGQQPYSQPYSGYQPPNYTAQSYRPEPPRQPIYTTPPAGYQQKSRLAAGILAIILGVFGVHNFYLGFNSRGVIQLVLSLAGGLLTCGLATAATVIWAFIEGVTILSSNGARFDGNGVILRD